MERFFGFLAKKVNLDVYDFFFYSTFQNNEGIKQAHSYNTCQVVQFEHAQISCHGDTHHATAAGRITDGAEAACAVSLGGSAGSVGWDSCGMCS